MSAYALPEPAPYPLQSSDQAFGAPDASALGEGEEDFGYDPNFGGFEAPDATFYAQYDTGFGQPAGASGNESAGASADRGANAQTMGYNDSGMFKGDADGGVSGASVKAAHDLSADGLGSGTGADEEDEGVRFVVDDAEDETGAGYQYEATSNNFGKQQSYHRVRRNTRRGGLRDRAPAKSVFEELSVPVPDAIALPHEEHLTLFEITLDVYKSRPWEMASVVADDYFNFGLTPESWARYARTQVRVKDELARVQLARQAGMGMGMGHGAGGEGVVAQGHSEVQAPEPVAPPAAPAPRPVPSAVPSRPTGHTAGRASAVASGGGALGTGTGAGMGSGAGTATGQAASQASRAHGQARIGLGVPQGDAGRGQAVRGPPGPPHGHAGYPGPPMWRGQERGPPPPYGAQYMSHPMPGRGRDRERGRSRSRERDREGRR